MDESERLERARFWARLASVKSLDEIPSAEHASLAMSFAAMRSAAVGNTLDYPDTSTEKGLQQIGKHADAAQHFRDLKEVHRVTRKLLLPLVQGKPTRVEIKRVDLWSIKSDGTFEEYGERVLGIEPAVVQMLAPVLRGSRHLFHVCPQCGAVFVRVRRQRYCSPNCTAKALGEARREEKAEYMRRYRKRQQKAR